MNHAGDSPKNAFSETGPASTLPDGENASTARLRDCTIAVPCELVPVPIPMSGGLTSKPFRFRLVVELMPSKPLTPLPFPPNAVIRGAEGARWAMDAVLAPAFGALRSGARLILG